MDIQIHDIMYGYMRMDMGPFIRWIWMCIDFFKYRYEHMDLNCYRLEISMLADIDVDRQDMGIWDLYGSCCFIQWCSALFLSSWCSALFFFVILQLRGACTGQDSSHAHVCPWYFGTAHPPSSRCVVCPDGRPFCLVVVLFFLLFSALYPLRSSLISFQHLPLPR